MSVAAVVTSESDENDALGLRINVRHWRKESGLAFRYMPVYLWQSVMNAALKYGVARVACVVGVNLEDQEARRPPRPRAGSDIATDRERAQFIDVPIEQPGIVPPSQPRPALAVCAEPPSEAAAPRAANERWIEVVARGGAKLTRRRLIFGRTSSVMTPFTMNSSKDLPGG